MARQLRYFTEEATKASIPIAGRPSFDYRPLALDQLETRLATLEGELQQLTANSDRLRRSHAELLELELVLDRASSFFDDARRSADISSSSGVPGDGYHPDSKFVLHY
jgi:V-type H+-transporting ATPase subunit a